MPRKAKAQPVASKPTSSAAAIASAEPAKPERKEGPQLIGPDPNEACIQELMLLMRVYTPGAIESAIPKAVKRIEVAAQIGPYGADAWRDACRRMGKPVAAR